MKRDIVSEFDKKYQGIYKYKIINYTNNKQIIDIICKIHGGFKMSVLQHLNGYGCPYCAGYKETKSEIIEKMRNIHDGYYDYSISDWIKKSDIIKIICPKHGIFEQSLSVHIRGHKCQECSNRKKITNKDFIKKIKSIDSEIITSITEYINSDTKVKFICKKHGIIEKYPNTITNHICNKCYISNKNKNSFINKCLTKFGNKYDYSLVEYVDQSTKVRIIDTTENIIFEQCPDYHLMGKKVCKSNIELFIKKSNIKHNNKYSYKNSNYNGSKNEIEIYCDVHGVFKQSPNNHLRGTGCPKCNRFNLKQLELSEFIINNIDSEILLNNREVLNGKEIDIYIPNLKIGFEFNGLYWHSEKYKGSKYHLNKTKKCIGSNIDLVHIWEDDWDNKKDIVKSMILNKIGVTKNKIFARKCIIKEIFDIKLIREFLNKNHIQGFLPSKLKFGLFFENELVSIMTFGELRISLGNKKSENIYELLRFCNKIDTSVIGGASKLMQFFIRKYNPSNIISYSDFSRSNGNLYKKLGFKFLQNSKPNYYYIIDGKRKHRFSFRKDRLVKEGFDSNKTEIEIMKQRGYDRIFDCGSQKWIFNN